MSAAAATPLLSLALALGSVIACSFDGGAAPRDNPDAAVIDATEVIELCGNGLLDGEEACDDGNSNSFDGCSNDCLFESGFECPDVGADCTRIVGVSWIAAESAPTMIGSSTGGDDICDNLVCECATDQVLVGLQGGFRTSPNSEGVAQLRKTCAPPSFELTGTVTSSNTVLGVTIGNGNIGALVSLMCPEGAAITGLRGLDMNDGGFVRALELDCSPIEHTTGALALGSRTATPGRIGESGTLVDASACSPGQVAVGLEGSSGNVIDRLALRCAVLMTTP